MRWRERSLFSSLRFQTQMGTCFLKSGLEVLTRDILRLDLEHGYREVGAKRGKEGAHNGWVAQENPADG